MVCHRVTRVGPGLGRASSVTAPGHPATPGAGHGLVSSKPNVHSTYCVSIGHKPASWTYSQPVLVSKALGSSIEHLADAIRFMGVRVDTSRLYALIRLIASEVDEPRYRVVVRRVRAFTNRLMKHNMLEDYDEEVMA